MNTLGKVFGLYGGSGPEEAQRLNRTYQEFMNLEREIRVKLGEDRHLLDRYLDRLFKIVNLT